VEEPIHQFRKSFEFDVARVVPAVTSLFDPQIPHPSDERLKINPE
jgi:hypothetical protein